MAQIATITSKRQLTIPTKIFKKVGLSEHQKVLVEEEKGVILIAPLIGLVEKLAGSLKMPAQWQKKDLDEIIEESKAEYFARRSKR